MSRREVWDAAIPPIHFTYDGEPSTELLPRWKRDDLRSVTGADQLHEIRFTDPTTGLAITAYVRTFIDYPATDWVVKISNAGANDTPILEGILPLHVKWHQSPNDTVALDYANGSRCEVTDFLPKTMRLEVGQSTTFKPFGGRSSDGVLPFFNLYGGGVGTVIAVGWSGQWLAQFDRAEEFLSVCAGLERTHLRLRPGEEIRTPRILVLDWDGKDPIAGNNLLRRLLMDRYCRHPRSDQPLPPVAHMTQSTYYATDVMSEADELDALSAAHELGVEAFWMDACWYGTSSGWSNWHSEVGNWFPRKETFPNGVRPLSDAAHDKGMKFVLWMEPERVYKNTEIDRSFPQFLLTASRDVETAVSRDPKDTVYSDDNRLFNLGSPAARQYVTGVISNIIETSGVDIYRQDFNMEPLRYWQEADAPDREGMSEIRHIEGLYAMWDDLLDRHPGLLIDNCASGGRRIDLETVARSFPLWRSDFSDVGGPKHGEGLNIGDQCQTAGLSRWVPFHSGAVWTFTPYAFRSAMSTGIVVYSDVRSETFASEDARLAIMELKRLRRYLMGDIYPLTPLSTDPKDWCAHQYHRPDSGDGIALVLRRGGSSCRSKTLQLQCIDSHADYEVGTTTTFIEPQMRRVSGQNLAVFDVEIDDRPGSILLQYRPVVELVSPSPYSRSKRTNDTLAIEGEIENGEEICNERGDMK